MPIQLIYEAESHKISVEVRMMSISSLLAVYGLSFLCPAYPTGSRGIGEMLLLRERAPGKQKKLT